MTHKRGVEALGGEPILLRDYMGRQTIYEDTYCMSNNLI